MGLTLGTRLGIYEIRSLLGVGGVGEVYCARDTRLHRDVAIKVLSGVCASDAERLARFDREAQLLAALNHPHIAQIYGFEDFRSTSSDHPVVSAIVLELVDGPTLANRIAEGPIPFSEALSIARQTAAALAAAHQRGIVHRDLKPANIKLTSDGTVKVLDFGLAKVLHPDAVAATVRRSQSLTVVTTEVGAVVGTAAYMAPEQARGKTVDKRADIWAFGVVLYEMLTGCRPFDGETVSDTIAALLRGEIDWTRLPAETPDDLRQLLERCLEREPEHRLAEAAEAVGVIAELERQGPRRVSRVRLPAIGRPWLLAAAIATLGTVAGVLLAPRLVTTSAAERAASPVVRFAIEPPATVASVSNVTLSADGRLIVYAGQVIANRDCSCGAWTHWNRGCSPAPRARVARSCRRMVRGSASSAIRRSTRCPRAAAIRWSSATRVVDQARRGRGTARSSSREPGCRACRWSHRSMGRQGFSRRPIPRSRRSVIGGHRCSPTAMSSSPSSPRAQV